MQKKKISNILKQEGIRKQKLEFFLNGCKDVELMHKTRKIETNRINVECNNKRCRKIEMQNYRILTSKKFRDAGNTKCRKIETRKQKA